MESKNLSLNIIGDIVFPSFHNYKKYNLEYINKFITPDSINIANLEAPILNSLKAINKESLQRKKIIMYSQSKSISFLNKLNINVLTLANNHIFDFGYEGFNQTTEILNNNNIKWFGAGKNFSSSIKPLVIEKNNIRIGFIGISWRIIETINSKKNKYGVPSLNHNYLSFISDLKKKIDFLIIYFHWGYEHERFPLPYHRKLAYKMIDSGANLIVGSHPHRVQGIEEYSNGLIAYSLGNFIIPIKKYVQGYSAPNFPLLSKISYILNLEISKDKIQKYNIVPFKLKNKKFQKLSNKKLFAIIMKHLSDPLHFNDKEYRRFFRINRKNKYLPILTNNEYINKITFQLFYSIIKIFQNLIKISFLRILIKSKIKL